MRFQRLQIPAYGPFTNLELAFPARENDLHVFYGKNEAGKSSLLRAIRDMLFGIHGQSPDDFVHDYKDMRLGGEITNRAGDQLSFQRRKGNKNTLLDGSGNALPDHALRPFLGTIEQGFFSTMFGLGSSQLREGARQILGGDGDLGKALFSASLGGTPVQRVLDALVAESEKLFKGRGTSNVTIRPAAKRYSELLKQSREAVVAAEVWDELNRKLDAENTRKALLEAQIVEHEVDLLWVSRCEDALPCVSRFNEEERLLRDLPVLPAVASDFVERAKTARAAVGDASRKVSELSAQIARDQVKLDGCATAPEVLAMEDELDGLHQDLGAYRARKESLANLQSRLAGIEPALRSGMQSLEIHGDFEVMEGLRLGSAARLGLEAAAQGLIDAEDRHAASLKKAEELTAAIKKHETKLQSEPEADLEPLRAALATAAEAMEANKTLDATRATVDSLTRKAEEEHSWVYGAPQDLEAASRLPVPAQATLRKYRERFSELERDIKAATKKISDEESALNKLGGDLTRMERRGELPTEDSLRVARDHRDQGWQLVLKDWKGGGADEQLDPDLPLEEAFPRSIQAADKISDQLRNDADTVAQAQEKRLQIQSSQDLIKETEVQAARLQTEKEECQTAWVQEWAPAGISPRSPAEMEEWRESWIQFRETLTKLRDAEGSVTSKAEQIQQAVDALKAFSGAAGPHSFPVILAAAKAALQKGEEATGRRKLIAEQLEKQRDELEDQGNKSAAIFAEIQTARTDWQARSQSAGLAADTAPAIGRSLLRERTDLTARFDQWKECSEEAKTLAGLIDAYETKVSERAAALRIAADSTEAREAALWKILSAARTAQSAHDHIASQIAEAKENLTQAREEEDSASKILRELMSLAQVSAVEELEPLLAALERKAAIQERLDDIRDTLGGLARGQTVEEFVGLVQAEDADALPQRKIRLDSLRTEKKAELVTVQAGLNDLNKQREDLARAGDTAADLRQQAESELATLRRDASQFIRLRLAAHFLRSQIEQFREQNQAPLLEKSGQVFQQITKGAFGGLAAEFNADDVPVLVGSRAGGGNVPLDGMSDGTRDQLYLALRLAALDRHLEEHEPMPLILDDLLITFDNDRTRAILPQLADLSKRTQVFLFTHHEHLVELCRETLGEGKFQLHALSCRGDS